MTTELSPQANVMVANSVAMEMGTNNLVIMGAFDGLQSSVFPVQHSFYAVAKVWGMPAGDKNQCVIKLVDPETEKVLASAGAHQFASTSERDVHTAISLFNNVTLPKSGSYEARAYAGDKVIGSCPIWVKSPKA